jgi:hypothetical protein
MLNEAIEKFLDIMCEGMMFIMVIGAIITFMSIFF